MLTQSKRAAWLAAGVLLASSGLLAACDKSAQHGDGTAGKNEVGTAAYTPNGQVTPIGADSTKLDAPEITAQAPADGPAASATSAPAQGGMAAQTSAGATGSAAQ